MRRLHRYPDVETLVDQVAVRLLSQVVLVQSRQAIAQVCIAGEPLMTALTHALRAHIVGSGVAPERLGLWWSDDLYLPTGHPDRNVTKALQIAGGLFPVHASTTHAWPAAAHHADAVDAARAYADEVAMVRFDLTLLSLAPDGSVAGLAPGSVAADPHRTALTAVADKGDDGDRPARLTLTAAALNRSRSLWVLASGEDRADVVSRVWQHNEPLPAHHVHGERETRWFVDQAAAAQVDYHRCSW